MELLSDFNPLTLLLIGIIALLAGYFHTLGYSSAKLQMAPTLLTSVGIFGTFLGIAVGLANFESESIENSVPLLIDGLKTAFWSSIAGLLGALSLKFRQIAGLKQRQQAKQQANIDDLHYELSEIHASLDKDADNALPQLSRNLDNTTQQGFDRLLTSMRDYQTEMVRANSEALVQALETVMRDFNTKIDEQYGDNFKRLNQSVELMIDWQTQHKDSLQSMQEQLRDMINSMSEASAAYQRLMQHTNSFANVSESLESMLTGLETQSKTLNAYLTELSKLVENASVGLPQLEGRILSITENLGQSVSEHNQQVGNLLTQSTAQLHTTLQQISEELTGNVQSQQEKISEFITTNLAKMDRQLHQLDQGLEEELNKSLKTLGNQLTALSEKFVSDYAPLTDRLRELVQMAQERH